MRILLATDAWSPQINGVVRTYQRLQAELEQMGIELAVLGPQDFRCVPCPSYPDIGLALPDLKRCADLIEAVRPDAIHIATEGPVGWMARRYCTRRKLPSRAVSIRGLRITSARAGRCLKRGSTHSRNGFTRAAPASWWRRRAWR